MKPLIVSLSVLLLLSAAAPAAADGMAFPQVTGSTVDVEATAQRAVLWRRGSTWELHLQPQFDGEAGELAWVVPFPVRPTVSEGSVEFLDQLERLTAPLFVETCTPPYCYGGEAGYADASGGTAEIRGSETAVTVWETGTVGMMEYVILSAGDGDSLAVWMNDNGYRLPTAAGTILEQFETEGLFFFVSRLPAGASPEKLVAPIRFELPGMDPPVYPLRLTALGVPDGTFLDLTLWVVFTPNDTGGGFLPDSHPFDVLTPYRIADVDDYRNEVDAFFAANPPEELLLLFAEPVRDPTWRPVCDSSFYYYGCQSVPSEVVPGAELNEIAATEAVVQRYQARLTAAGFAGDLVLRTATADELPGEDNAYVHSVGACYSCPPDDRDVGGEAGPTDDLGVSVSGSGIMCGIGRGPAASAALGALAVLALLGAVALRRRRRT
ncbi:MAG: DUF2330 domain-containing protein [Deltaproteobacteria bacterium]|nr:DUF2330 domain-containing protein [Deltaproteobacteria bacterium]